MGTLYDLTAALKGFEYEFDEDGVWTNEEEFEQLGIDRDEKIKNCLYAYKNAQAVAEMYETESTKLKQKQKRAERKAEGLKEYIQFCLNGENWKKDDCPLSASHRTSERVILTDTVKEHPENFIPTEYLKHKEEWTPIKDDIKKAIKSGKKIEGCSIEKNTSMTIK